MGYEQVKGTIPVNVRQMWAGWFPGKTHNDIPGDLQDPNSPVGSPDCDNAVWLEGKLQKFFGYNNVNTSALESGADITSLFYSPVLDEFVGTVSTKVYSSMDAATPTDITGTATVSAGTQSHITEWQFETTKLVIGVQQGNPAWKWDGTGTAAALGGSPPQGQWIANWQNAIWIGNTATEPSSLFFSNLGDPETWTTNDDYKFDAPITGMGVLGDLLVVFMDDHIGVLSGTNNRVLTKVDRFIEGVGCTGGFTIAHGKIANKEVLVFHARDGFYAFDGSREPIKLSRAISQKYTSGTNTSRWNENRFSNAWATYVPKYNWYICGLADAADTENGFVLIMDLGRPFQLPNGEGIGVPVWRASDQVEEVNCITLARDSSGNQSIFFGSDNGIIYKYDPSLFNRDGTSYTASWKSKIFDLGVNTILQEVNLLGDELGASGEVDVAINYDLQTGDGETAQVNMQEDADVLDSTFIMGTSLLGGRDFIFKNVGIDHYGRFFQFKVTNNELDQELNIQGANFVFKSIGLLPNAP